MPEKQDRERRNIMKTLKNRAEYLEKKVIQLNNELDYCKRKLKVYESEGKTVNENNERPIQNCLMNDCVKLIKDIPDEQALLNYFNLKEENYGPFGVEKIKILENSFNSILENMLCCGSKLMLYVAEKELPKTKADYERYDKLKKFKSHEIYPDPLVRKFIESRIELNMTNDQYLNFYINQIPHLIEIKHEMKEGINMLFNAKTQIYKALMMHHLFKLNFMNMSICKEQLISLLKDMKDIDLKVSYEQVFNVQKEDIEITKSLDIIDPEVYANVTSNYSNEPDPNKWPKSVSKTFTMIMQK